MNAIASVSERTTRNVDIVMLVLTCVVVIPRLILSIRTTRTFGWDDGWLLASLVFCIALIVLWLYSLPTLYRLVDFDNRLLGLYPEFLDDIMYSRKVIYSVCFLFLATIWATKFSLLSFYKGILNRLGWYITFWWITVVTCALTLFASFMFVLYACEGGPKAFFEITGCLGPDDDKHTLTSFWFIYAADVVTTLMVMLCPLGVIRQSHMPLKKKLSIITLFCLGFACIIFATIRTKWIDGAIKIKAASGIVSLALWGSIEATLACIIASAPGLYREFVQWKKARPQTSKDSGWSSTPSQQSAKFASISGKRSATIQEVPLASYRELSRAGARTNSTEGDRSSQENLTRPQDMGAIHVTRSVGVNRTDREWNRYDLPKSWENNHYRAV